MGGGDDGREPTLLEKKVMFFVCRDGGRGEMVMDWEERRKRGEKLKDSLMKDKNKERKQFSTQNKQNKNILHTYINIRS